MPRPFQMVKGAASANLQLPGPQCLNPTQRRTTAKWQRERFTVLFPLYIGPRVCKNLYDTRGRGRTGMRREGRDVTHPKHRDQKKGSLGGSVERRIRSGQGCYTAGFRDPVAEKKLALIKNRRLRGWWGRGERGEVKGHSGVSWLRVWRSGELERANTVLQGYTSSRSRSERVFFAGFGPSVWGFVRKAAYYLEWRGNSLPGSRASLRFQHVANVRMTRCIGEIKST